MVQAYSENITVNSQSAVPFNTVVIEKGTTVRQQGNTFLFEKAGIYCVVVNASVAPSAQGEILIDLQKDNQTLKYAAAQTSGTAGDTSNLSFTTLVRCPQDNTPCCASAPTAIQVWNDSDVNLGGDFNIVVTKIC